MRKSSEVNKETQGGFDDTYISLSEFRLRMLLLSQIKGSAESEALEIEGMNMLEEDVLTSVSDDSESYANDSFEMNIKKAPCRHQPRTRKIMERRASTGSFTKENSLKSTDAQPNSKLNLTEVCKSSTKFPRRFSNCAA